MERLRSHEEVFGRLLQDKQHNNPLDNRPTLSFPLGTSLVVLIIVFITAVFSFCYHWHKLRRDADAALNSLHHRRVLQIISELDSPQKQPPSKLEMVACLPVVYMPGDEMPKFIALPCPCLDVTASVSKLTETGDGNKKSTGAEAAMESKTSA